jgi:regulator of replication initiation timing
MKISILKKIKMDLRSLASLFVKAANVDEENVKLRRDNNNLKYQLEEHYLRREIAELRQEISDLKEENKRLREAHELYKKRAGEQKHIADMLQVKLDKLNV